MGQATQSRFHLSSSASKLAMRSKSLTRTKRGSFWKFWSKPVTLRTARATSTFGTQHHLIWRSNSYRAWETRFLPMAVPSNSSKSCEPNLASSALRNSRTEIASQRESSAHLCLRQKMRESRRTSRACQERLSLSKALFQNASTWVSTSTEQIRQQRWRKDLITWFSSARIALTQWFAETWRS